MDDLVERKGAATREVQHRTGQSQPPRLRLPGDGGGHCHPANAASRPLTLARPAASGKNSAGHAFRKRLTGNPTIPSRGHRNLLASIAEGRRRMATTGTPIDPEQRMFRGGRDGRTGPPGGDTSLSGRGRTDSGDFASPIWTARRCAGACGRLSGSRTGRRCGRRRSRLNLLRNTTQREETRSSKTFTLVRDVLSTVCRNGRRVELGAIPALSAASSPVASR